MAGGASNTSCVACPDGTTTFGTGAILPIQCVAAPHACAAGEQLTAPGASTCTPLVCDAPLAPSGGTLNASTSCVGCGAGSAGAPKGAGCSAAGCATGMVCPGLLSIPLVNFSAGVGGSSRAAAAWASAPPLLPPSGSVGAPTTAPPSASMTTVYTGGALVCALTLLAFLLACTRACPATGASLLTRLDAFSLRPPLHDGEGPFQRPTPLGGVFTLMGVLTLCTYALYMILEWQLNNTLVQRSLSTLGDGWADTLLVGAAWVAAPAAPSSPLVLRVLVDGEPGRCNAPLEWSGVGLAPGSSGWRLLSTPSVGGSGVAAHTFSCAGCVLTPAAALSVSLHYSCQSLLLEATAGAPAEDGSGGSTGGGPKPVAVSAVPGALLSTAAWTLTPLLSVVSNNITGRAFVGYSLTGSAVSSSFAQLAAPSGDAALLSVLPTTSVVRLSVALPLQPVYTQVSLSQRVPWTQLLANIVGLTGVVGFFGMLYGQFEKRLLVVSRGDTLQRTRGAADLERCETAPGVFVDENPLYRSGVRPREARDVSHSRAFDGELAALQREMRQELRREMEALRSGELTALRQEVAALRGGGVCGSAVQDSVAAPPSTTPLEQEAVLWFERREDDDVWFVSSAGEMSWVLPEGARLAL